MVCDRLNEKASVDTVLRFDSTAGVSIDGKTSGSLADSGLADAASEDPSKCWRARCLVYLRAVASLRSRKGKLP